ncbi:hypothetical protein ACTMMZ_28835, partial [Escherichia coli]|uniref:hypothetical protein n=2 Tax=Escherichia coli TaxID=562 RepID=UPI003F8BD31E
TNLSALLRDFMKCSLNRVLVQTSYAGAIMRNKRDIEDLAFEALRSAKKIREVVNMWMNSLSTDESDSREEILISLLLDLANTQVSLTSDIELAAKKLPLE